MKRIAVYCGASKGNNPIYVKEAYQLGKYMAEQGYELIFGAGSVGIMGYSRWRTRLRRPCNWSDA